MTTPNALEKLSKLAAQRTARTDRLEATVHALLACMDMCTKVGDSVTVDGFTLERSRVRSNVGSHEFWSFSTGGEYDGSSCYLNLEVGADRYLHGDFHAAIVGPSREDLIAFAARAGKFVAAFVAKHKATIAAIDAAERAAAEQLAQLTEASQ